MIFTETAIPGAFIIDMERKADARGYFARIACVDEFAAHGLRFAPVQASVSWNERRGTLRGLHYQTPPHVETKLVRCTAGAVYDVMLDTRRTSPAFGRWVAVELDADNGRSLFIPEGVAHGFQSLVPHTELCYQISARYAPEASRGIRWDDPVLAIKWPLKDIAILSEADKVLPDFETATRGS